jgi:hypothetical protein
VIVKLAVSEIQGEELLIVYVKSYWPPERRLASNTPVPAVNWPLDVVSPQVPTVEFPLNKVFKSIVVPDELHSEVVRSSKPAVSWKAILTVIVAWSPRHELVAGIL